jgi:glyceraldehyde-3-phosphate dehydrogenase (NADP+)
MVSFPGQSKSNKILYGFVEKGRLCLPFSFLFSAKNIFFMDEYRIYIGGRFQTTKDKLEIKNPFSGELIASTWVAGENDLEEAIDKAQEIEKELLEMPSFAKYEVLMQIAASLKEDRENCARLLSLESAKPMRYAWAETDRAIQTFIVAAEESKRLPKEYIDLDWTVPGIHKEGLVRYFPVGVVAGISPFNFPLNLAVHKIAPAIAAGCPIILKPSSTTPLSTLNLARIIDKTALPKGAVSVIPMDRSTGNQLVTDERIKLLTFTGSPEVGWKMKNQAGKKKVVLELGGNAAVIVAPSADIESAVAKNVIGGFSYSGQVCIHAQRLFVQKKVFDRFAEKFIKRVNALKFGDPVHPETEISVMIDESNAMRVEGWVNEALAGGAERLAGGKRDKSYYPPTVLTGTKSEMKVRALEIFGPVVVLETYSEFEEALVRVNEGNYGLQAGVFTDSIHEMNMAFNHVKAGGVIINDVPTYRADHMPYGGVKDSGLGREGVKYAIIDMMEARILVKDK